MAKFLKGIIIVQNLEILFLFVGLTCVSQGGGFGVADLTCLANWLARGPPAAWPASRLAARSAGKKI